jgi:hypothetical protein
MTPIAELIGKARQTFVAENDRTYYDGHPTLVALEMADALEALAADLEQRDDLLIKAEKLRFTPDVTVESRGASKWAVCSTGSEVLNIAGEWEWEPTPSGRDSDFIARTRFTFAEAVTKARALSSQKPGNANG